MLFSSVVLALSAASMAFASPLEPRAEAGYTVRINSASDYCLIMPRKAGTTIGDSESSRSQMQSFCTNPVSGQGQLPKNYFTKVAYKTGTGKNGKKWKQRKLFTGRTINWSHLKSNDGGGQYDSNGGAGGRGNPSGSVCEGYPIYVEIVEPDVKRACIRCCQDKADCPTNKDTAGCPSVIPGTY
ncbi:allergen protein [Ceratobasidium sp. AG-Ba]|nr:allergen protein [Ceratobasidium sp. AG-Ba]